MKIYTDDFYAALGVAADATPDEIRRAHRAAALKYHPDKNNDKSARELFLLIQNGYEVLSNPTTRADYDRQYHERICPQPASEPAQNTEPTRPARPARPTQPRASARPAPRQWPSWPPQEFTHTEFNTSSTPASNFEHASEAFSNGAWWNGMRNRNRAFHAYENNVPGQSNPHVSNFEYSYLDNVFAGRPRYRPQPVVSSRHYFRNQVWDTEQGRYFPRL